MANEKLKREYDFSKGVRGKFYRPRARLRLPVYLDAEALVFVERIAQKTGTDISSVVNQLILADKRLADMVAVGSASTGPSRRGA